MGPKRIVGSRTLTHPPTPLPAGRGSSVALAEQREDSKPSAHLLPLPAGRGLGGGSTHLLRPQCHFVLHAIDDVRFLAGRRKRSQGELVAGHDVLERLERV